MGNTASKPLPLLLIGGGGHALVVAESAVQVGFQVVGYFDDNPDAVLGQAPVPGAQLSNLAHRLGELQDIHRIDDRRWILGIGNLAVRAELIHQLDQQELATQAQTIIHPSAVISPSARIGRGVFIGPRAVINARALIQDHAIINTNAIIEHECEVGYNTHIAPGAILAGGVRVGSHTLIGMGARVLPMLSVGESSIVGAGAVIIKAVLDKQQVVGVPGRVREMV